MKKRLIAVLLVLSMVASWIMIPAQAATEAETAISDAETVRDEADNINFSSTYCPACGREDVTWTPFSGTYKDFVDGEHIYLTKDINVTSSGDGIFIAQTAGVTACIHLNGHSITATQKRALFINNATMNIMDHKDSPAIISGNYGQIYGGTVYVKGGGGLNLYGGTLTKDADNVNPVIYTNPGTVNLYDGAAFECGSGTQAGIYISSSSVFNMYGGSITGGVNTGGYGGSIRLASGAFNMYGGSISGGAASVGGDCIYVENGSFKMTGGMIDGEVLVKDVTTTSVELSGTPVITGKGLVLPKGKTMTLGEFAQGASIAINTTGAFITSNAAAYAPYFKAAVATDFVQESDGKLYYFSNDILTTGMAKVTAWCPVCKTDATWEPLSGDGTKYVYNNHYFLASDIATSTADGALKTSSGNTGTACVHLNGHNIIKTDNNRAIYVTLGTLNIMGNGTVQANYQQEWGCTIYMNAAANLNLYGGTYKKAAGNPYPIIRTTNGVLSMYDGATVDGENIESSYANVHVTSTFNMYGGQIKNGNRPSGNGGNLYIASGKTTLYGGKISDGYASGQGGNIMIEGGELEIAGATITGGEAGSAGGNLCINGYPVTMSAGVMENGQAPNGGNVYMTGSNNAAFNMTGGVVQNGNATNGTGGNFYIYRGVLTVGAKAALIGGIAKTYGGSVYLSNASGNVANLELYGSITGGKAGKGGNIAAMNTDSTVNMYAGALISGGEGTDTANDADDSWTVGNVILKKATFNMKGGVISDGISTKVSKNVFLNSGAHFDMSGGTVYGNSKETNYTAGSAIRSHGSTSVVTLSGDAKVIREDGEHLGVMRCYNNKLVIKEGWSGQASVTWYSTSVYGIGDTVEASRCETTGDYTGKLVYEDLAEKPWIHADGNGTAVIADKKLVNGDTVTWPKDIVAANAAAEDSYIVLMADAALEIQEGSSATVDLAGFDLTVTGTGTVYGMNSANLVNGAYIADAQGTLTTESATVAPIADSVAGKYIAITDGKTSTFHRLDMKITDLTLNAKRAALYYTGEFGCDDTLAAMISDYGISYSVVNMPSAGDTDSVHVSMWEAAGNQFTTEARTCFISNIFAEGKDNAVRGKMPIYANPYVVLDGQTIMADATTEDKVEDENFDGVAKSLYDVLRYFDQPKSYYALEDNRRGVLDQFYLEWSADLTDWAIRCLGGDQETQKPLCDGKTLRFLSISSSFGLNTTQLLYDIAKAQGVENVVVGRLYASGCSLEQHVKNAQNNIAWYEYTKNVDGTWVKHYDATMEYGLNDEDWDVIFIQNGAAQTGQISTYGDYIDQWMAYLRQSNPNARFVWNMTWAYDQNTDQSVFEYFNSDQMTMYNTIVDVMHEKILPRNDFAALIPSGTAIQNARTYYGDTLTVDTYHLNNLGKAIAGYTLYAMLTGQELTEINLNQANGQDSVPVVNLTKRDKQVILEAVNNALRNPYEVTQTTYTDE